MVKLVIWDLDGTLVNSLPVTFEAMNDGIEPRIGRRLPPSELVANFGGAEATVFAKIVGHEHAQECFQRYAASTERRLHEILPHEGILEAIQALGAANYQQAIFTGRARRTLDIILKHLSLEKHFIQILAGDEVDHDKPHPEGVYKICKATGVNPVDTIFIGDSHYDILAGRTAGAQTVAATWDRLTQLNREKLAQALPTHTIMHPEQLRGLLD